MAKKRRKKAEEEEKYEFVPPEFDEKQFLIDEMKATKRILLTVGYGIGFAILAAVVTAVTETAYLGLLLLFIGWGTLKSLYNYLRFDTSKFTKRNWLESGFWFFFTFLAVWVLICNPPFFDNAPPDITDVRIQIYSGDGGWTQFSYVYDAESASYMWVSNNSSRMSIQIELQNATNSGAPVEILAHISDNDRLGGVPEIVFRWETTNELRNSMTLTDNHTYVYTIDAMSDTYLKNSYFTFRILTDDASGHSGVFTLASNAEILIE